MVRNCFVLLASCFLLAGCAKSYVLANDRVALWAACTQAVADGGYDTTRSDMAKGVINGTKTLRTDEKATEKNQLTLTIEIVGGQYRATVNVKQSGPPVNFTSTDMTIRRQRSTTGGRGRVANEFGTVATRDFEEEKIVLARIRELLAAPPPAEAPPEPSP